MKRRPANSGPSFKRGIDGEDGPRNNVFVVNISGDADDAVRCGANSGNEFHHRIRPEDVAVDGILIGEHSLSESLTDHNDRLFALAVELIEIAAGDDGNTERGKKAGRDGAQLGARILFAGPAKVAVGGELEARTKATRIAPGNDNAESGLVHTG